MKKVDNLTLNQRSSAIGLSLKSRPLITIITAVFNGETHLEETIQSIIQQTYDNVEYIIIDGGSTDGTLDIIRKYENHIDYWVSEPDKGISDAFNKGIRAASGTYVNFQGDGDGFHNKNALLDVFEGVDPEKDIFISARIERVSPEGKSLYFSKQIDKFNKTSLLFRMSLPHQGLFTHINYFKKYGLFDVENTFCMDYEHLLRSYNNFPNVTTKNIIVAKWRADGFGNNRALEIFKEYDEVKRKHKVSNKFFLSMINVWVLFKYGIKMMIGLK